MCVTLLVVCCFHKVPCTFKIIWMGNVPPPSPPLPPITTTISRYIGL